MQISIEIDRSMAIPASRQELLNAIETNFDRLCKDLGTVSVSRCNETTLEGHAKGTVMSVHNLVSYLLGWSELVLKWIEKDAKGKPIDFPESNFSWSQLGTLAQKFYSDFKTVPFDQFLKELEISKQKIVAFISAQTNEQLYGSTWYEKYTMGRMIQFNTSSPARDCDTGNDRTVLPDGDHQEPWTA